MCSETLGAAPVKRCTCAASATFSNGSRGTPGWAKTLKRVPELPNAQEGSSITWHSRSLLIWSKVAMESAALEGRVALLHDRPHGLLTVLAVEPAHRERH